MFVLNAITLADKIKKIKVKVPKLPVRKTKPAKKQMGNSIPASVIINIMIKAALEKAKSEKKEKQADGYKKYNLIKEENEAPGGYGTASKNYGTSTSTPYVDYGKLFSYLGKFRAKGAYESIIPAQSSGISIESKSFELVGREAMDKGARYVKYMFPHGADFLGNLTSLVPVAGMNSAEWEQFKLWMQLDPVMYKLKISIS